MESTKHAGMESEAINQSKSPRRHRSTEEKQRIVEATFAPGISVSQVAEDYGVRPGQVYQWRKQYGKSRGPAKKALAVSLLPVEIATTASNKSVAAARSAEVLEIELAKGRLRIVGADAELVRAALEMLR